ncbi:hypothetical protein [Aminobacter phage Erebus]|nr:hypothetical protein [Aminobacter phage Erebus]
MMATISFRYKNHRGEISIRTVDVDSIEFLHMRKVNPKYGHQPGWFISGRCHTKDARRSFALCNIILPSDVDTQDFFKLNLKEPS